jgi:N-acetylated-alpha-linked acidic dipeptidase
VYLEPREQGAVRPPYPEGPSANRAAVPRGSLLKSFLRPGDPRRAKSAGVDTLPKIPALAVSQEVAEALLRELSGPAPPPGWKGLLDAPYALGPGPARARMTVRGRTARVSLRSVLASIPGADPKAASVVLGSHFDAWVFGAADPSSGTAAALEAAAVLARIAGLGWKPSRPVVFAFFDGEEAGMFGSTPWLEERFASGDVPALALVNVESAVRSNDLFASATPGLRGLLAEALERVRDPALGVRVADASAPLPDFSSDASPFLGFSATPVAGLGSGRPYGGSGTVYDTLTWLKRFGDPGFSRTATLARVLAFYTGVLATPRYFPLRFGEFADFAGREVREIQRRHPSSIGWLPQAARPLASQIEVFEAAARAWDGRARAGTPGGDSGTFDRLVSLALGAFGAPGESFGRGCRLWGPSRETGCGAAGLPALEDAVSRGDRAAASAEIDRLAGAFSRARDQLVVANMIAEGRKRPPRPRPAAGGARQQ